MTPRMTDAARTATSARMPGTNSATLLTMRLAASLMIRCSCTHMARLLLPPTDCLARLDPEPLGPAPAGNQVRLLHFEYFAQPCQTIFDIARTTGLLDERRQPAQVQRRQRPEQMIVGHGPRPVGQRKVVDDLRPELVAEPKLRRGCLGQRLELEKSPRCHDPGPHVAQRVKPQPEAVEHRFHIDDRRARHFGSGPAEDRQRLGPPNALPG